MTKQLLEMLTHLKILEVEPTRTHLRRKISASNISLRKFSQVFLDHLLSKVSPQPMVTLLILYKMYPVISSRNLIITAHICPVSPHTCDRHLGESHYEL